LIVLRQPSRHTRTSHQRRQPLPPGQLRGRLCPRARRRTGRAGAMWRCANWSTPCGCPPATPPRWLACWYAAVREQALRDGALPQTYARRCRAHPSNSM